MFKVTLKPGLKNSAKNKLIVEQLQKAVDETFQAKEKADYLIKLSESVMNGALSEEEAKINWAKYNE